MLFKETALVMLGMLLGVLAMAMPANAIVVEVGHQDLPTCDFLFVPDIVDELGVAFPPDELIRAVDLDQTSQSACPTNDMTGFPNVVLAIDNFTQRSFTEVWYVADPETSLSNVDGLVNNEAAFRIDSQISDPNGLNLPLISESIAANDIFEPGERWEFIIDDYANALGLPPSALTSQGLVGGPSSMDPMNSSGSIIAIPEPSLGGIGGMLMLGLAGMLVSACYRRR